MRGPSAHPSRIRSVEGACGAGVVQGSSSKRTGAPGRSKRAFLRYARALRTREPPRWAGLGNAGRLGPGHLELPLSAITAPSARVPRTAYSIQYNNLCLRSGTIPCARSQAKLATVTDAWSSNNRLHPRPSASPESRPLVVVRAEACFTATPARNPRRHDALHPGAHTTVRRLAAKAASRFWCWPGGGSTLAAVGTSVAAHVRSRNGRGHDGDFSVATARNPRRPRTVGRGQV